MPSFTSRTHAPRWNAAGQCSRDAAGLCELKLRRRLLQQQLSIVNDKYGRVAQVVAKKQSAKLSQARESKATQGNGVGKRADDRGLPNGRAETDFSGGGRRLDSVRVKGGISGNALRGKTHEQQGLFAPMPFRRGGRIDFSNKKHILRDKQREMEREKTLERRRRQNQPSKVGARDEVAIAPSVFPDLYMQRQVPCSRHYSVANALVWVCPLEQLDYDHYLPMFFDGIRCVEEPCRTLARQGVYDLLTAARGSPERILPSLPSIMKAIRLTISCKNPELLVFACGVIRELVVGNKEVGDALMRYYKLFLNILGLFATDNKSTGDRSDYRQRKNQENIGEAVMTTLETLERHGGKKALALIKHCIPACKRTKFRRRDVRSILHQLRRKLDTVCNSEGGNGSVILYVGMATRRTAANEFIGRDNEPKIKEPGRRPKKYHPRARGIC